jgi:hypothetical protein
MRHCRLGSQRPSSSARRPRATVDAVTPPAATAIGRTARLVLLLATAFGLALMHTLGHAGVRTDLHTAHAAMAVPAVTAVTAPMALTAATPCPGGHCDGHGSHDPVDAWSVCLAILAGLAAIVLLLWLFTAIRGRRPALSPRVLRVLSPRAPPDRMAGLTLASTTVLRI